MNKILLSLLLTAAGISCAHAQYDYSSASRLDSIENAMASANARLSEMRTDSVHKAIWSNTSYFNIFYSGSSTSSDIYKSQKAKFGVGLSIGTSYLWPRSHAWGNVVKIGFDIRYLDLQFAMYDKFARPLTTLNNSQSSIYEGWTSNMGNTDTGSADNETPNYATFDQMQFLAGLIGIGPTVTVAPLSFLDNAASQLRVNLYFHYQPTFGANFYKAKTVYAPAGTPPVDGEALSDESEMLSELGYVSMFDWGFKFQWRNFGLGFECRWGSGKLHGTSFNPDGYYKGHYVSYDNINMNGTYEGKKTYTRKYAESRVYLNFNF